jgi:hypothetical protein
MAMQRPRCTGAGVPMHKDWVLHCMHEVSADDGSGAGCRWRRQTHWTVCGGRQTAPRRRPPSRQLRQWRQS